MRVERERREERSRREGGKTRIGGAAMREMDHKHVTRRNWGIPLGRQPGQQLEK